MHVISRKRLLEAGKKHGQLAVQLDSWYRTARSARWTSLGDVRGTYPAADGVPVGDKNTVFNISGNAFRLVTPIFYADQAILVRQVLTHAEYDRGDWKK